MATKTTSRLPAGYRRVPGFEARRATPALVWLSRGLSAAVAVGAFVATPPAGVLPSVVLAVMVYYVAAYAVSDYAPELAPENQPLTATTEIIGVDDSAAAQLDAVGYATAEAVAAAEINRLATVGPFDREIAERIQSRAIDTVGGRDVAAARLRRQRPER